MSLLEFRYTFTLTRATTDMSSAQAEGSSKDPCKRSLLTSLSALTSPRTLLAASCANCFAAVVRTEVDDPVSKRIKSLSNLGNIKLIRNKIEHQPPMTKPGSH